MNKRNALALLGIACLALSTTHTAWGQNALLPPKTAAQSHHDLPGEFDLNNPSALMADRLRELRELHELQDQVQGMLRDPDFVQKLQRDFSEEQLRQLREKLLKGQGLNQDGNWNRLLQQAADGRKLNEQQIEVLRRWAERKATPTPDNPNPIPNTVTPENLPPVLSGPTPPPPMAATAERAEPSLLDRAQDQGREWLADQLEHASGDLLETLLNLQANGNAGPLDDLLREMQQVNPMDHGYAEAANGLSQYVPDFSAFVREQSGTWDGVRSLFHDMPLPSAPRFGGANVSLPATPSAPSGEAGSGFVGLLLLLAVGVLLWQCLRRWKGNASAGKSAPWHLGSWPVRPSRIASRHDLIRAFEYLALRSFGPAALTCHHRHLAARFAVNPDHREAAESLAGLYEHARYAPPDEALSPTELSAARHALRLLASGSGT